MKLMIAVFVAGMVTGSELLWAEQSYRDPTAPLTATPRSSSKSKTVAEKIVVQSVKAGESQWVAIINHQLVQIGDRVAGYRVEAIDSEGVWLSRNGRRNHYSVVARNIKE